MWLCVCVSVCLPVAWWLLAGKRALNFTHLVTIKLGHQAAAAPEALSLGQLVVTWGRNVLQKHLVFFHFSLVDINAGISLPPLFQVDHRHWNRAEGLPPPLSVQLPVLQSSALNFNFPRLYLRLNYFTHRRQRVCREHCFVVFSLHWSAALQTLSEEAQSQIDCFLWHCFVCHFKSLSQDLCLLNCVCHLSTFSASKQQFSESTFLPLEQGSPYYSFDWCHKMVCFLHFIIIIIVVVVMLKLHLKWEAKRRSCSRATAQIP